MSFKHSIVIMRHWRGMRCQMKSVHTACEHGQWPRISKKKKLNCEALETPLTTGGWGREHVGLIKLAYALMDLICT